VTNTTCSRSRCDSTMQPTVISAFITSACPFIVAVEASTCDNAVSRRLRSHTATFRYYDMPRLLARQVLSFFVSCTPNDLVFQPLTLRAISPILSKRRLRFPALSFRTRATMLSFLYLQAVSFFRHFVTSIYMHRNSFTKEPGCIYL
jgi:hypothetical protein